MLRFRWVVGVVGVLWALGVGAQGVGVGWPVYGGGDGGQRYSAADQITPKNVSQLRPAWVFRTGALARQGTGVKLAAFEATPVLGGGDLFLSTPFDEVISLDAATGRPKWRFDPHLAVDLDVPIFTSRGVALWTGKGGTGEICARRVFLGTLDARLIALDALTGKPCAGFGQGGAVDLKQGITTQAEKPYFGFGVTSPPTVVGDVVVVGSAVIDNEAVDVEPGVVRGYDASSGRLRWRWSPLPPEAAGKAGAVRAGAGNTWGAMAADPEHGIVYLPTGSLSPDFFGGLRPGEGRDADSLVALDAATGRKLWAFQTVHHDLWDYDVAAEPLLLTYKGEPAVAVATKTGMIFVLNRLTGKPLTPIHEQAVAQSTVPGESTSPTQPISDCPRCRLCPSAPDHRAWVPRQGTRSAPPNWLPCTTRASLRRQASKERLSFRAV